MLSPTEYTVERLVDALVERGALTADQRQAVLVQATAAEQRLLKARARGGVNAGPQQHRVTPVEVLASLHLTGEKGRPLDEDRLMETVAELAGLDCLKIDPLKLDHNLITETMTRAFARRQVCLPVRRDPQGVTFAVDNPFDHDLLHQLGQLVGGRVAFVVSSKRDILRIIGEIYGFRQSVAAAERDMATSIELNNLEQLVRLKNLSELEANDRHVVNAVEYLLHYAYGQRASDIHLEPVRDEGRVRLRIDGVLHEIFRIPEVVYRAMVSRLKTLSRLDIAERRRPQDGRIKTAIGADETEIRVATMPVAFGEKMVLRIFDPGRLFTRIEKLGFEPGQLADFEDLLEQRHGMILVTGPTGSGKTTTLYSALHRLAGPEVNIVSVEDPIEMVSDAFNQVQVHRRVGLDFASALRSILRQDPDIIMLGEVRDPETAQMAVQAALTGHLVFSTLHTNDTASAITRLQDLEVPDFLIASTLLGVVAQRLVRLVCEYCAAPAKLSAAQARALEITIPAGTEPDLPVRLGSGCARCRDTGLYGRQAVFEVLPMSETVRDLIRDGADAAKIAKAARADGMITLREATIRQLAQGQTSFNEVLRVLGPG